MFGLEFARLADDPAVPGGTGLDLGIVRGVKPNNTTTPAETGDGRFVDVAAILAGEGQGGVDVGQDLSVGNLGDDVAHEGWNVFDMSGIALASVKSGSDGVVALLCQAAAEVLDVFVDTEDFLNDENDGKVFALFRPGAIGGDFSIGDPDFYFSGSEAIGVRSDGLSADGLDGERETSG